MSATFRHDMACNNGLEGVVAAATRLSHVDGERGELIIAGFPVGELAAHATFEETTWLLWHGDLPTARSWTAFRGALAARARASAGDARAAARVRAPPRRRRWTRCASPPARSRWCRTRRPAIVARVPTIVAAYCAARGTGRSRSRRGRDLGHAANYPLHAERRACPTPSACGRSRRTSTPSSITASTPRRSPRA